MLEVIRGLVADEAIACGILIIDHDLRLIMRLCDRIHVLNEGSTIAEGTPEEIRADRRVIEAYLGRHRDPPDKEEGASGR